MNDKANISVLHGDFSNGKTHDAKEKCYVRRRNSLYKSKVHGLVKLFKDKFVQEEEARRIVWKNSMVQGSPPNRVVNIY